MTTTNAGGNNSLKEKMQEKANTELVKQGGEQSVQATVWGWIKSMEKNITAALPKHMDTDRLVRIVWTAIRMNPNLFKCSKDSLIAAVMQSAQLGLEPGVLGQAYLIPYWNTKKNGYEAQFQIG